MNSTVVQSHAFVDTQYLAAHRAALTLLVPRPSCTLAPKRTMFLSCFILVLFYVSLSRTWSGFAFRKSAAGSTTLRVNRPRIYGLGLQSITRRMVLSIVVRAQANVKMKIKVNILSNASSKQSQL